MFLLRRREHQLCPWRQVVLPPSLGGEQPERRNQPQSLDLDLGGYVTGESTEVV